MKQLQIDTNTLIHANMKTKVFTTKLKTRRFFKNKNQLSSKAAPSKLTLLKRMIAQKQQLVDGKAYTQKVTAQSTRSVEGLKNLTEEKQLSITFQQQLTSGQKGQSSSVGQQQPLQGPLSSPQLRSFPQQTCSKDNNPRSLGQPIQLRLPPTQAQLAAQVPPYPSSYLCQKKITNMQPATAQQQQQQPQMCVRSPPFSSIHPHPPRLIQQSSMPQTYSNQMVQDHDQHRNPQQWQHWQEQQQKQQQQQHHLSQHQYQISQQQYYQQKQQQQQFLRQQQHQQQQVQPMSQYCGTNPYHLNRQLLLAQASPAHSYYPRVSSSENLSQPTVNSPPFQPVTKNRANTVSAIGQVQIPSSIRDSTDHLQQHPSHQSLPVFHKAHSWVGGTDQSLKSHNYEIHPVDDPQQQTQLQQLRLQQQQPHLIQQQQQQQYNHQHQQYCYSQKQHQQVQFPQRQSLEAQTPRINPVSQFSFNFPETCKANENCQSTSQNNSESINTVAPNNSSLSFPSSHQSQQLIQTEGLLAKGRSESWSQMQSSTPSTIASKFETSQKLSPLEPTHQLLFSSSSEQQHAELEIADFFLDSTIKGVEDNDEFGVIFNKKVKSNSIIESPRKIRNSEAQANELLCTKENAIFQFNNNNNNANIFENNELKALHNNPDTYFSNNNNQHPLSPKYNFHHGILSKHTLANSNFFSDNEEFNSEDHFFAPFQPS